MLQRTLPPAADFIPELVRRIVDACDPVQVILFGSQARGDTTWDSDVDLLVVLDEVEDKRVETVRIMSLFRDLPVAVDVVVATPEEVGRRHERLGSILHPALQEGKVLYDGRTVD